MALSFAQDFDGLRRVAFDANALIYYLERVRPYYPLMNNALDALQRGGVVGVLSTIVEMEILVKPIREQDQALVDVTEHFLQRTPNLLVRPLDRAIARRAAQVRAATRLAPPDAIIAATALEERCEAIVGNDARMAARLVGIQYLYLDDYIS